jgi:hypothetical protein
MGIAKILHKQLNRIVGTVGFQIDRSPIDFSDRLDGAELERWVHSDLAQAMERYLRAQNVFDVNLDFDFCREVENFYARYISSPYRVNRGGSRYNNLLWLFVLAKAYRPTIIIDSGTFKGASAWALAMGAPDVPIHSFDPDMSQLIQRTPGVDYHRHDWTVFDLSKFDVSRGLVYFDDHVDQVKRLNEAAAVRFPFAVFDDDFAVTSFAPMAHGGFSLPKIEFVFDQRIRAQTQLAWISRGRRHVWPVDVEKLDHAASLIAATDRLVNTSEITGIWQTPYRIVSIVVAS